jgi:hypothetical protein
MSRRYPLLFLVCLVCGLAGKAAAFQPISCSGFLHNHDGSWRSVDDNDVLGPSGPVHIGSGDKLWPAEQTPKGEIARALNSLCESY